MLNRRIKKLLGIILFIPIFLKAQNNNSDGGIKFEKGLHLEQIFAKAKKENKFVFIDCYTSWCSPCRKMEKDVYTKDSVGAYINSKFISVKIQMDTAEYDADEVKRNYSIARQFMITFEINAFPSYLFFSSTGKMVHRDVGFKNPVDFIAMAKIAIDSNRQYCTLIENYKKGNKNFLVMPWLANMSKRINKIDLSNSIAQDYIYNHLLKLPESKLYTVDNIKFISSFVRSTKDESLFLFYEQASKIDSLMNEKGYSQKIVDYAIIQEIINPILTDANLRRVSPNWRNIRKCIKKKFNRETEKRILLTSKIKWYQYKEHWPQYIKFMIKKVDRYGAFGIGILYFDLNNHAWDIFLYSNNILNLNKALKWSESAIKMNPHYSNSYDTYANILYKLGRKNEAIIAEERAVAIDPQNSAYRNVLEKMKRGDAVWQQIKLRKPKTE